LVEAFSSISGGLILFIISLINSGTPSPVLPLQRTISSSLKFKSEIKSIKKYLIKKGAIVHTPESWKDLFNKEPSKQELDQIVKNYDKMISKSDVLFVINKNMV